MGVAEQLRRIIVDQLGVDASEVTPDASFTDDLGADSLDLAELTMAVEEEFGIEVLDEEAEKIGNVGEAVAYVIAVASRPPVPAPAAETPAPEPAPAPVDTAEVPVEVAAQPAAAGSEDTTIYAVVVNHEEQYSIWPASKEPPAGWAAVGTEGTRAECQAYISEVWTDMRPLSVRRKMGG